MTIRSILGAALCGVFLACAGIAHAQEALSTAPGDASPARVRLTHEQIVAAADYAGSSPSEHADAMVDQIVVKLQVSAGELGIATPAFDLPVLRTMVANAMPRIPDDRDIPFTYTITFNVSAKVQSTELAEREDGVRLMPDARGCGVADIEFQIVHFNRLEEDGYAGHHCVLVYDAPEGRMMRSQFYMRNARRDVLVDYDFIVGLANSYDASQIVAERTLNANIILAQAIGLKGLDMLKVAPEPAD